MEEILKEQISFNVLLKKLPQEGNLVYEYNPFRNYRLDENKFYYKEKFYSIKDLAKELEIESQVINDKTLSPEEVLQKLLNETTDPDAVWGNIYHISKNEYPILYEKGLLVDFDTNELNFSINNPVDILPQYSYDGSVNLILNDGKNSPKLINSRFSPIGKNKYKIYDRKGNNDTNIYDLGSLFDIDTSLYKGINNIPKLVFRGVLYGGNLSIGNYHFYFKYCDADGNESDFVAESGLVSVFIGTLPNSIRSGFRNENSQKLVRFSLLNIDTAYLYVKVYFTRNTGDIHLNETVSAFRVDLDYIVLALRCEITITGFENTTEIPLTDLNLQYQICSNVGTLASALNMLFLGNVLKQHIPYEDLADIALRFVPQLVTEEYPLSIDLNYKINSTSEGYYDPEFIYNKVGYWPNEIYRFGIVFILADNTLSPVFNTRGGKDIGKGGWTISDFTKDGKRNFITYDNESFIITSDSAENTEKVELENTKGVISLSTPLNVKWPIIGIKFDVTEEYKEEMLNYLKDTLKIKGFFFVRQKRMPTTLCLAYTIGIDPESHTPVIPTEIEGKTKFIAESFLSLKNNSENAKLILTHDLSSRLYPLAEGSVKKLAAICPEYDINSPYFNSLFTGQSFTVVTSDMSPNESYLSKDDTQPRSYYVSMNGYKNGAQNTTKNVKILGVEDNVKLVAIGDDFFSARAGEAEEAFRYEYIDYENKTSEATNLLRGSFGPYLAITGLNESGTLIDIKIPGYKESNIEDYFKIRYNDKSSYYAVSERIDINNIKSELIKNWNITLYRGDCYICQFTHRINRNFQDPSAPTNDKIVDPNCWEANYEVTDGVVKKENFERINLGDVNAVLLGLWVTFTVRSSYNLNIRAIDDSIVDEVSMFGVGRGFFPYYPICPEGSFKIPEALCFNKGFSKGLSERWNFEVPDVPILKDEYSNRVLYSDIHVTDAFRNGFRVFLGTHYRDYPKTYGSITKLVELDKDLICIFEHGIGVLGVNERIVSGEGTGGPVYINTLNVLPEAPFMLSDSFGSQWKDSIIKTPKAIYGVDTVGKKIWRCTKSNFEIISNSSVQKFLNDNISLTERELTPIIGVRNVKTHYNASKGDVMFTFYDNLHGFEEKAWNLCWNELLNIWVTFYSWIPSYSENIYNLYFSFDRNTSKNIAKLGISNSNNDFSDGVTLDNNILSTNGQEFKLSLSNRLILESNEDVTCDVTFEIVRDNYGNWKNFDISEDNKTLRFIGDYTKVCSEFYLRVTDDGSILFSEKDVGNYFDQSTGEWKSDYLTSWTSSLLKNPLKIYKNDRGLRMWIDRAYLINPDKLVIYLNLRAHINMTIPTEATPLLEAIKTKQANRAAVDMGYYESVVAIIPKYNLQFLTTDFWKHGRAGIIDIADKIYPTYWYGKQHPFEFEFVVSDFPENHKIFDNLEIISNKAAPESFHYEIVGDSYEFAKDKKNMYIRQEATKELYLFNGSDILFDPSYKELLSEHRPLTFGDSDPLFFDKSTIFPAYYYRLDTINEIEDYYHLYKDDGIKGNKDFSALAGAELVRYKDLDEYRIWNHTKAVDITKKGLLRGNMYYKEDVWHALINPINLVLKNETKEDWKNKYKSEGNDRYDLVPAECNLFPPPVSEYKKEDENSNLITLPNDWERNIVTWKDYQKINKEAKVKDKFIKIRIRYSGKDLAIISAIRTLYSISYA